jgi:hypothetical protein
MNMNEKLYNIIYVTAIVLIVIVIVILPFLLFPIENSNINESSTPVLEIGCNRLVWAGETTRLNAVMTNMAGGITYRWWIDGTLQGEEGQMNTTFPEGSHIIHVKANSGTLTLENNITITAVSSTTGISVKPIPSKSYGIWRFQAYLDNEPFNVAGIQVSLEGQSVETSKECSPVSIIGIRAGNYTWSAQYHGQTVGSGIINVPAATELMISRINIKPTYRTGDTISSMLKVTNVGTLDVDGFQMRTTVINNKFAYMGDVASREYNTGYTKNIVPGESVHIPINTRIPEKIKGIRPTGQYTINLEITYAGSKTITTTLYTKIV